MSLNARITMLGTGSALATRCYNTCFVLRCGGTSMLVDAGGGNGILTQLERAGLQLADVRSMFITHVHTDHILGAVWVVRTVIHKMRYGEYSGTFVVYSHGKALRALEQICRLTLPAIDVAYFGKDVIFREVSDGEDVTVDGTRFTFFDILSGKERQFGFVAHLPDQGRLVCLGDEPYNEGCRRYAEGARWLMCEAFCLYADRGRYKPYEKHHSTALDAGKLAGTLSVENLILYHTEDNSLATRRESYAEEAGRGFAGRVYVPDDLETIILQ